MGADQLVMILALARRSGRLPEIIAVLGCGGSRSPQRPGPNLGDEPGGAHRTDRTAVDARGMDAGIEPPVIGRVSRQARPITFRKVERHESDNTRCRSSARHSFGDGVRFWPATAAWFHYLTAAAQDSDRPATRRFEHPQSADP